MSATPFKSLQRVHPIQLITPAALLLFIYCIGIMRFDHTLELQRVDKGEYNPKYHRNLPLDLMLDKQQMLFWQNQTQCGHFPAIHDINIQNTHWQKLYTPNETVVLLSAFYDNRISEKPVIQVLAGAKTTNRMPALICQMWFKDLPNPVEVPVNLAQYTVGKHVYTSPFKEILLCHLVTCPIPVNLQDKVPDVVSMVHKSCEKAINALKVVNRRPKITQDFAVCVKSLWSPFQDRSVEIAEWIETNLALGVKSIQFYVQTITAETRAVLDYYERIGVVKVIPMEWPGSFPTSNLPWLQKWYYDNVKYIHSAFDHYAYNDCLYNNLYSFKHLALIDTDEILMPVAQRTWQDLFKQLQKDGTDPDHYDSIIFPHFYFFGNKTSESDSALRILGSNLRTSHFMGPGWQVKGIFNVKTNEIVFNHKSISCLASESCRKLSLDPKQGRLNHYRPNCIGTQYLVKEKCDFMKANLIEDNLALRFRHDIESRVEKALEEIYSNV